jgi:hypothetical protein
MGQGSATSPKKGEIDSLPMPDLPPNHEKEPPLGDTKDLRGIVAREADAARQRATQEVPRRVRYMCV